MAFTTKNFVSITASLLVRLQTVQNRLTDFNIGSICRTMLESIAAEIDVLYQNMLVGLIEAIATATFNTFSFPALGAQPAGGLIAVNITAQASITLIPAGTIFTSADASVTYISAVNTTIAASATTVNVLASASQTGVIGNIPAGLSFTLTPNPIGFVSASNAAAMVDGANAETFTQHQARFGSYIQTLPRGTIAALQYGATQAIIYNSSGVQTEAVRACIVNEPWVTDGSQPISLVKVFIHNGVGSTSGALVALVNQIYLGYVDGNGNKIPGWKAAGVKVVVAAAADVALNVTGVLSLGIGAVEADVIADVESVLATYIQGLNVEDGNGSGKYDFSVATALVMAVSGVADVVFSTPTANQSPTTFSKYIPGTLAITGP